MLNSEVRKWLKKVEMRQYSYEDTMREFLNFSAFLTRDEMKFIKTKIESSYQK